jgi:hypothetical protein
MGRTSQAHYESRIDLLRVENRGLEVADAPSGVREQGSEIGLSASNLHPGSEVHSRAQRSDLVSLVLKRRPQANCLREEIKRAAHETTVHGPCPAPS